MALQPLRDEQLNYFKFASIVVNEFPKALRQTFKSMWDNSLTHLPGHQLWDDSTALRNLFFASEGSPKKTKVPTKVSYEEWDCTALFHATIYARSFALHDSKGRLKTLGELFVKPRKLAHGEFHASVTSPNGNKAETFSLAIDQLRRLRNSLCHSHTSEIVKATFDRYVQHAKEAFKALGVKTDPIDAIGGSTGSEFRTNRVRRLEERIKEEYRAYVSFLQQQQQHLECMYSDVKALKRKMEVMPTKDDIVKILEQMIKNLKLAPVKNTPGEPTKDALPKTDTVDRVRKLEDVPCSPPNLLEDEYKTAVTRLNSGDFALALQSAKCALDITQNLFGEEHRKTADHYFLVGLIQGHLGNHLSAFESAKRALDIRRKLFGKKHSDTARSYYYLGAIQQTLGDYKSALESTQRALVIRKKLIGKKHYDKARSYHNLEAIQPTLGDYKSPLESTQRAEDIRRMLFGEEHSNTAQSHDSLVDTQYSLGDYKSSLESTHRALDIRKKLFNEEYSDTAQSCDTLGPIRHSLGDYKSPLESTQRARDIRKY